MANEHKWEQDVDGAERCMHPGCSVRRYVQTLIWQRKKGAHWCPETREPLPPCTGKEP